MSWREFDTSSDNRCLRCDSPMDRATSVAHGNAPTAGDPALCIYCGELMFFTSDLRLRRPTLAEHMRYALDPLIARARFAITEVQKKHRQ